MHLMLLLQMLMINCVKGVWFHDNFLDFTSVLIGQFGWDSFSYFFSPTLSVIFHFLILEAVLSSSCRINMWGQGPSSLIMIHSGGFREGPFLYTLSTFQCMMACRESEWMHNKLTGGVFVCVFVSSLYVCSFYIHRHALYMLVYSLISFSDGCSST